MTLKYIILFIIVCISIIIIFFRGGSNFFKFFIFIWPQIELFYYMPSNRLFHWFVPLRIQFVPSISFNFELNQSQDVDLNVKSNFLCLCQIEITNLIVGKHFNRDFYSIKLLIDDRENKHQRHLLFKTFDVFEFFLVHSVLWNYWIDSRMI